MPLYFCDLYFESVDGRPCPPGSLCPLFIAHDVVVRWRPTTLKRSIHLNTSQTAGLWEPYSAWRDGRLGWWSVSSMRVRSGSGSRRTRRFRRGARIEAAADSPSPSASVRSTPSVSPPRRQWQPPGRLPTPGHVLSVGPKRHQTVKTETVPRPSSGFSLGMFLLIDSGFYRKLQELRLRAVVDPG